jgi:hypothetical protein
MPDKENHPTPDNHPGKPEPVVPLDSGGTGDGPPPKK